MRHQCPYCEIKENSDENCPKVIGYGHFYRKSDSQSVQRFRCLGCKRSFSGATRHPCYRQNKRQFNEILRRLLSSGVSQRRLAKILNLSRTTVVRKFLFLAAQAEILLERENLEFPQSVIMEFDDQETFEHTKCKPLSITLAVEFKTRRILGFEVSQMPANGKLASISRKKYGPRPDKRSLGREKLFTRLQPLLHPECLIKSDQNPHYPKDVKKFFPAARHKTYKGKRGCTGGQGELKKVKFDPIFSLNHTCAMLRANINRLFRKTWCTTKKPERLRAHIAIYALYHNRSLKKVVRI
jgi:transposase-like protein